MVELQSNKTNDIPVKDLKDGQIAVITRWNFSGYEGFVIQRWENRLVSIGCRSGNSWDHVPSNEDLRVRILEDGEILVITNNQ